SPEVIHVEPGITVLRFIDGRTFAEADMRENLDRLVPLLKTCHREVGRRLQGPANMFWVFHVIREYVRAAGADAKHLALSDELERRQVPLPIVFGHHDLLPGNFMDDGRRLWLIDWEYGGFGTAMFDLANISANNSFSEAHQARLLEIYFERMPDEATQCAFDAMKTASTLREAMWGMVSELHLNAPGVDYVDYAEQFLDRFQSLLPGYEE